MSVSALISDAQYYSGNVLDAATAALADAKAAVANVGYTITMFNGTPLPATPGQDIDITPPTLDGVTLDFPSESGAAPDFQDIAFIDAGSAPELAVSLPTITLPTAPAQLAEFLESAPAIDTDVVFPEPPSVLLAPLIDAPTFTDRVAPDAPQVALPAFTALTPTDTTVAPTGLQATFENAYASAAPSTIAMLDGYVDAMLAKYHPKFKTQMSAIEAQLEKFLAGGTGLNGAAENAIYERARSKNRAEALRVRDSAYADAASRGFTLPPGALLAASQRARQAGADNNAQAAREIVVLQAEMEQKNLQFAVTTSTGLRVSMLNATLSYLQNLTTINGQALEYAKTVLAAIIETYNTAVKAFGLKLEAYKAEAMVYDTKLKGALAVIELYKAQIDALQALTNVDRAKVDVYRARIDSLGAFANVYKAQIDAVQGRASLEKLKLDIFQAKVQAYSAQVQGKNAEWQGYTAAIGGETAKANLYRTQVEAFSAQVSGYKTTIEAKAEVVRAASLTNRARAEQYAATLSGYTAVVQARGEVARVQLENERQKVLAFQVQSQAAVAKYQVRSEYYKAVALVGIENAKLSVSSMLASAENKRKYGEALANLSISSAKIYGSLASAAMSGMNTLAAETSST